MKVVLWITAAMIIIVSIIATGIWFFKKQMTKEDPEYVLKFIKENTNKDRLSFSLKYNGETWAEINPDQKLPLASTVKIIVAIEYAKQAAAGKIDPQEKVSIDTLNTYYLPKTDGGAHEAWLAQYSKETNEVAINEVAEGMMAYSSNANTDYLIQKLGLDNINQLINELDLQNHESLYPLVSPLFIPKQLMNSDNLSKEEALERLKDMEIDKYKEYSIELHNQWLSNPPTEAAKRAAIKDLDMDFQKVWSDRLPAASSADYLSIMEKLNSKTYFDTAVHEHLDPIIEQLMKNPTNSEWMKHAGQKGGSTAFVFTIAMYVTDKEGNTTELVFLANDLSTIGQMRLAANMNSFQLAFLTEEEFRKKVKAELTQ
ncbi:serine hydrolase [Bacillus sp. CRN 9]|nr:serine hydrolase [Bacillus sp. CRN 9]